MVDELRLKRVQRVAGGAWILISDNLVYERELIKPEDLQAWSYWTGMTESGTALR